jgi:hypothetical protein
MDLYPGDPVTVVDAANAKEPHQVRCRADFNAGFGWAGVTVNATNVQLAGLDAQVARDYVADQDLVRVVKWPSGELVGRNFLQTAQPSATIGSAGMIIDELKLFSAPKWGFAIGSITPAQGSPVSMNSTQGMSAGGGAIVAGDEIIAYKKIDQAQYLDPAVRGWLNSYAHVHDAGDPVFRLEFLPISTLSIDVGAYDWDIPYRPPFNAPSGYVLIDQEVIGFDGKGVVDGPGTPALKMPRGRVTAGDSGGIYRGSFGTDPAAHGVDSLVYGLPWRYWDSHRRFHWDERMPYYQLSTTRRGARWRSLRWLEERPSDDMNLVAHVFVRADGLGELYGPALAAGTSRVWEFTQGGVANKLDHAAGMLDAGQLDVRFTFEWRPSSFWPGHSWKRAMRILQVDVESERDTKVLFHEDD